MVMAGGLVGRGRGGSSSPKPSGRRPDTEEDGSRPESLAEPDALVEPEGVEEALLDEVASVLTGTGAVAVAVSVAVAMVGAAVEHLGQSDLVTGACVGATMRPTAVPTAKAVSTASPMVHLDVLLGAPTIVSSCRWGGIIIAGLYSGSDGSDERGVGAGAGEDGGCVTAPFCFESLGGGVEGRPSGIEGRDPRGDGI